MGEELLVVGGQSLPVLSVTVLAAALTIAAVGLYPLLTDEPLQESLFFFLLCLSITVWLTGFGGTYQAAEPGEAMRWIRLGYLGVPLIPAALYTVTVHILGIADRRRRSLGGAWILAALFVVLTTATDAIITDVTRYSWGYYPLYTPAGLGFIAFVTVGIGASLREYWMRYRHAARENERRRAGRYLLAFTVGSLAVMDFLPCYGVDVVPLGHGAILAMSGLMGHTLRNYHLTELTPAFAADRILGTISDPVVVCGSAGRVRFVNDAATASLGYEDEDLVGRSLPSLLHESSDAPTAWSRVLEQRELRDEELVLEARDGSPVDVSVSASALEDGDGRRVGTAVVARDIRDRRELERQLRQRALHDRLTGIPNRALYEDRLEQALSLAERREGADVGLLYLDVDRFKSINDTYGHSVGDRVLRRTAERIQSALRDSDTAARVGGDEFTVVLAGLDSATAEKEARGVAERVHAAVGTPMAVRETEIEVSASIGVALAGEAAVTAEGLTRRADLAMYDAKSRPESSIALFEPELKRVADRRLRVERDLEGVTDRDELRLAYQPLMGLAGEEPVAFEALMRWEHPEMGLLSPAAFIPVAEETGQIRELGRWTLRRACEQMQSWLEGEVAVPPDARVMVNVSEAEVASGDLPRTVRAAVEDSGLPPGALELEVTERMVASEPEQVAEAVGRIRDLGVRVAIDDFGTGTASLRMVRELDLDGLKIDRSFIHGVAREERGRKFVRSIVDLAHELGLEVVAEGVEDEEDRDVLQGMGVTRAQGFLWSEPVWPEDIAAGTG